MIFCGSGEISGIILQISHGFLETACSGAPKTTTITVFIDREAKRRAIDWYCWDDAQKAKWGPYEHYVNPTTIHKEMKEQFKSKSYMATGRRIAQARRELREETADMANGHAPRKELTANLFRRAQRIGMVVLGIITTGNLLNAFGTAAVRIESQEDIREEMARKTEQFEVH